MTARDDRASEEQRIRNRSSARHYTWGEGCDGFLLVDSDGLSVIEEVVPPQAGETSHVHARAHQFFYILEGTATMHFRDGEVRLDAGDGVEVSAGVEHRFANHSELPVRFLVTSTPSTRGDRHETPTVGIEIRDLDRASPADHGDADDQPGGWQAVDEHGRVRGVIVDHSDRPAKGRLGDWSADTAEVMAALYTRAASEWASRGIWTHQCVLPAGDPMESALLSLGFGHQQAFGVLPVRQPTNSSGTNARMLSGAELPGIVGLASLVARHQQASPVFSPRSPEFFRDLDGNFLEWTMEEDVVVFGHGSTNFLIDGYLAVEVSDETAEIVLLAVDPVKRGHGIGSALLAEAHRWAHANGHRTFTLDWRTTNPQAHGFWSRAGARPTAYRWSRTIDPTDTG